MKKGILALCLLVSGVAYSQKSEVISDSIAIKSDLFSKSLTWVAKTWKNANEVIQVKDAESGTIVVKGGLASKPKSLGMPTKGMTWTQLTIRVKDGKAKIEFEDTYFKHDYGSVSFTDKSTDSGMYKKWKESVEVEMDSMILSYKDALAKKVDDF